MLIFTLVSGGMDGMDGCMYDNMYIGNRWYGRLYVCEYVHWYMVVWTIVCMLICTCLSDGMDGCMYVNIYICIWWYGRLYVC